MDKNKEEFELAKMNWINEKEISRGSGTGISRWSHFGDKSYMVMISKYSDSVLDVKMEITDYRKNKQASIWMDLHEAQIVMKALEEFFKDIKQT